MSNPVLRENAFSRDVSSANAMTVNGAIHKSALLIAICGAAAWFAWQTPNTGLFFPSLVLGLLLALVIAFKPTTAPFLAPVYAVAEGVALGTISFMFEAKSHGIVLQTLMLTGGVFCAMLGAYRTGLIRPTKTFFNVIVGATGGICLVYLASLVSGFFHPFFFIAGNGPWAIFFSLVVCGVAALNLILDFAVIEQGASVGAPKYMEWYSAFGLLVTLVWLYLEILRLLAKSRR
jgi:uncharacterized YccA/Bax inhibitor family protein